MGDFQFFHIKLLTVQALRVRTYALQKGISVTTVVRLALDAYLRNAANERRE